jgi:hypothetical protein
MLRLVFTICMLDAPQTCEQRELLVYDAMPVTSCVLGAMPELAVWSETHPNWRIARWHCEDDGAARRRAGHAPARGTIHWSEATEPAPVPVALSR